MESYVDDKESCHSDGNEKQTQPRKRGGGILMQDNHDLITRYAEY